MLISVFYTCVHDYLRSSPTLRVYQIEGGGTVNQHTRLYPVSHHLGSSHNVSEAQSSRKGNALKQES